MQNRILENDIKALVVERLKVKGILGVGDTLISEFTVDNRSRRTDLLLVRESDIWAVEVKSEFDSLHRLPLQVDKYNAFFDKVIVACAQKHTQEALKITPQNVEIWEITKQQDIKIIRRGKIAKVKNKELLLKLFKRSELNKLARKTDADLTFSDKKELITLLSKVPLKDIRTAVIDSIKSRYKLTTYHFWRSIEGGKVTKSSIKLLSIKKAKENAKVTLTNESWLGV
ncbi:sce7726 family protein [Paraglaciecola chathamensis]|uniref:sce7726 family protein n=1 Tax=Paraglaciecola chathamensis TaxID=368405 RepID=UPI0027050654|nr:sce7726 family protein [Paraglaciecola chathamensis]MDO6840777.1 sce7726 family protein [Paraglaciecola chathamensis]